MPFASNLFVAPSDPILQRQAIPIPVKKISSNKILSITKHMLNIAWGEQQGRNQPILVGLAAPQIGIPLRIILVAVGADGKGNISDTRIYINPLIVRKSRQKAEWYEGCYSTGQICGIVSRSTSITIRAYSLSGKILQETHLGYVARIFQHEIDHLNGIEFVNHIKDAEKLHWVEDDEFIRYRNREAWRTWPKKCTWETYLTIKGLTKKKYI